MKKIIFEDENLNEGAKMDFLAGVGETILKAGKKLKPSNVKEFAKSKIYKNAEIPLSMANIKNALNPKSKLPLNLRKNYLKYELDKTTKLGKAALGVGLVGGTSAIAQGINREVIDPKTRGNVSSDVISAAKNMGLLITKDMPAAAVTSIVLAVQAVKSTVGGTKNATSAFNRAVRAGEITGDLLMNPSKSKFANIIQKFANTTTGAVTGAASMVKNSSTTSKIAAAGAGIAAASVAAKLISDALKRKEWYNNGCDNIEDPEKKNECKSFVNEKLRKELTSKLARCKYANNPAKCQEIVKSKIESLS